MKKNKPLRAAAILLIATMLTTCMTAGTFAKYTTETTASDSARVAKFGVTVQASGDLYGEEYAGGSDIDVNGSIISYSGDATTGKVQVSAQGTNVVAPGTKNKKGLSFGITGTPEVDVKIDVKVETKNIYLKAGTYGVMAEAKDITSANFAGLGDLYTEASGTYTKANTFAEGKKYYKFEQTIALDEDYYPVVYTLTGDTSYTPTAGDYSTDTLAVIATELIDGSKMKMYRANTDLTNDANGAKIDNEVLTWEWPFSINENGNSASDDENYDGADTILGDLAAEQTSKYVKLNTDNNTVSALTKDTDYNLETSFNMLLFVKQCYIG